MNFSIPMHISFAAPVITKAIISPTRQKTTAKLAAAWEQGGQAEDMGPIASFNGGTSFSGTYASLSLAWPDKKNPRTTGAWWHRLVPDDTARVNISLTVKTPGGEVSVPLLKAVPVPDGAMELYGGQETVDIRLQDVTAVAARNINYTLPFVNTETVDPLPVAKTILGAVSYSCLFDTLPVDGCLARFPNALAAADDILMRQQDLQVTVTGLKRVRYGDRNGIIVYRMAEDPAIGAPFSMAGRFTAYDFEYGPHQLHRLTLEGAFLRITTPFINPYLDLASRIRLVVPRANIDEVVEVQDIRWAVNPGQELMTLKCRRQYTL